MPNRSWAGIIGGLEKSRSGNMWGVEINGGRGLEIETSLNNRIAAISVNFLIGFTCSPNSYTYIQGRFLGGSEDGAPLLKLLCILGGSAPEFLYQSCFSKRIDLAFDVLYGIAMMNFLTTIWLLRSL